MEGKLKYSSQFNAFVIADEIVDSSNEPLVIELDECEYERLGVDLPTDDAILIAFLLGREDGYYSIDFNYAYALAKAAVVTKVKMRLIGLDYKNYAVQMANCHALLLPGGSFDTPLRYYGSCYDSNDFPNKRSEAYANALYEAMALGMPVLGICAGAQVIAAEFGGLLSNDFSHVRKPLNHHMDVMYAHLISIEPDSYLYQLIGDYRLVVNSRHHECVKELSPFTGLKVQAYGSDGVPEAWGNEKDNILGVQWHPEDYVVAGDEKHLKVYQNLYDRALVYRVSGAYTKQAYETFMLCHED